MSKGSLAVLVLTACAAVPGAAQPPADTCPAPQAGPSQKARLVVAPGPLYVAGGLKRFLLGSHYRELWTTPVTAPVFDPATLGLEAEERGGGRQTLSLHLEAADGREYRFRSVDKEPSGILPRALRGTVADSVVQDQTSAALPEGALIVAPLLKAAGILHAPPRLVVMADSPALGEHREVFAGMLGTLEEVPEGGEDASPGFEGTLDVKSSEKLFELMQEQPEERIDARAFLKARLVDILIGDWDRHAGQWRWAKSRESGLWLPVPRDRDQAFARFDGAALAAARLWAPRLVNFGPEYPSVFGLGWNSRELDRRLLGALPRDTWDELVAELQRELGDPVLQAAACQLPPEHYPIVGPWLVSALKARRDALARPAREFYHMLAKEADLHAGAGHDTARIERRQDGAVRVTLRNGDGADPYVDRVFVPDETDEVRLYLNAGNDRVVSTGVGPQRIRVRVIGGAGEDSADDSEGGGLRVYDEDPEGMRVEPGPGTRLDVRPWDPPKNEDGSLPLDWGRAVVPMPWLTYYRELGVLVGGGVEFTRYGFRQLPYAQQHALRVGYSTGAGSFRLEYAGDFRARGSRLQRGEVLALASGFEVIRFHGFGNEREAEDPGGDRYRVEQAQYALSPSVVWPLAGGTLAAGPLVRYASTSLSPGQLIAEEQPYGSGDFGQAGVRARYRFDTRDSGVARRGVLLSSAAAYFPPLWSVDTAYGYARAEASTYVPLPALSASLAVRGGARRLWGRYPFHDAAFLGGWDTLRGLSRNRFAGDGAVYFNSELRLPVTRVNLFYEGELGVFGLADVGRVFLDGESSSKWHKGFGGGLWLSFAKSSRLVSATVAASEGNVAFYLHGGMLF